MTAPSARATRSPRLYQNVMEKVERERRISAERGLWDDTTGRPTTKGLLDAGQQPATNFEGGIKGGGIRLDPVHSRTLRPLSNEPDIGKPGSHTYAIKDAEGGPLALVDTDGPQTLAGCIFADIQSDFGANSLGLGTVRQIRDALLERYPGTKTITGQRITGAVSADRRSGSGPGREAVQVVRDRSGE